MAGRACQRVWEHPAMRRTRRVIRQRVGRRGGFLLFLAVLDVLYGWSLLGTPLPTTDNAVLPVDAWAWWWIGTGIVCLAGSVVKKDRLAYTAASVIKVAWAGLWAHLWFDDGLPRGWVSAVVWLTFAVTVVMVSGWPEQTVIVEHHRDGNGRS